MIPLRGRVKERRHARLNSVYSNTGILATDDVGKRMPMWQLLETERDETRVMRCQRCVCTAVYLSCRR